jgi:hypothetical protein
MKENMGSFWKKLEYHNQPDKRRKWYNMRKNILPVALIIAHNLPLSILVPNA